MNTQSQSFLQRQKNLRAGLVLLAGVLWMLMLPQSVQATPTPQTVDITACNLTVEIIAAPFAAVDSNNPGVEGPQAAMLAARIANTGATDLTNLSVHIGDGTTPGNFALADGRGLELLGQQDATHLLPKIPAGSSSTSYWPVTYPPTYDTSYGYTVWVDTPDGCSSSQSAQITTQSEISASANKLLPTGGLLQMSPQSAAPGEKITVQITGFTLGTIGQGPQPLAPYDAWLQPVGNLDFDPGCLRLVRSEVQINSVSATPFVDRLYFSGLKNYRADPADNVKYTFLILGECSTIIQPYQEAASGTQEKYNSDFSSAGSRVVVTGEGETSLQLQIASDSSTANTGDALRLSTTFSSNDTPVGYPENGSPVVINAEIPQGTTYLSGSATTQVDALLQYSTDGGVTWDDNEPADPGSVTDLRWILQDPVGSTSGLTSYDVMVTSITGEPIRATAEASLLNAPALTSATVTVNDTAPTPTPTPTATPTPVAPVVQSGSEGGLESGPIDGEPSDFLGGIGGNQRASNRSAEAAHKARLLARMDLKLDDLMPTVGPAGTTPQPAVPVDVLAITTAPDAQAVDFVDGTGKVQAVALGILSMDGPYEHDYGVCNRFKEYEFSSIQPVNIDGHWYWHTSSRKGDTIREEALIFHIFVDENKRQFHVDSRWVKDDYPTGFDYDFDYTFNMQVWSSQLSNSQALLQAILTKMDGLDGGAWQIVYHNNEQPPAPQLIISHAHYQADSVHIRLHNFTATEQPVRLYGSWRSYLDRTHSVPFEYNLTLPAGETQLTLSFLGLLDITLYAESNGFVDKTYTGGGLWFNFKNVETAQVEMNPGQCRALETIDSTDLLLAGCIDLQSSGVVTPNSLGLGRTLNPNGRPVDVSPYRALRFWAKGDGTPVRVLLETGNITDGDYPQAVFTPDGEWRQYILRLDEFVQQGFGAPVVFTGKDVIAVVWMNAGGADGSFALSVDSVSFTNSGVLALRQQPVNSADTGPRQVAVDAASGMRTSGATLYYSLDNGRSFESSGMNADSQGYSGTIPGQTLGSDVLYYVETTGANGYVSRLPFDAPASLLRYRVDDRPGLLVDDFAGARLRNRLDGGAGLFQNETTGGSVRAYRSSRQLRLEYAVGGSQQFAGYFTNLGGLDISAYTTLNLRVRGATGGEQLLVGLRDGSGNEPKLTVGALLPGGLTSEWRWVQIPLTSFATSLNRQDVNSLSLSFANGSGPATGTVYVDEIRFTAHPTPLVIGLFDDGNPATNSQGGSSWISAPGSSLLAQAEQSSQFAPGLAPSGSSLRLDYTVNPGGYALWHTALNGGAGVGSLSLWVKGSGAISPNLYLSDGTNRGRAALADYAAQSDQWQFVSIPLSVFQSQGVDTGHLAGFEVAFEFGSGSGTFWLDGVAVGAAGQLEAGQRTLHLRDLDTTHLALHSNGGGRWQATSDMPWLGAFAQGYGPANLKVWSLPWGMNPGVYTGHITLSDAAGVLETVTVQLHVTQPIPAPQQFYLPLVGR